VEYENVVGDNEALRKTAIEGGRNYRTSMGSGTIDCDVTILHHHLDI
jgi:hypothetical protein